MIFINNLDDGTECILSKFADDTKLGGVAGRPRECADIWRDLDRLEKRTDRNLMEFNKGKHQVLQLGRNNPMYQYRLGTDCLESSLAEEAVGVLVDNKLTMSLQCALVGTIASWAALCRMPPAGQERRDMDSLTLIPGKVMEQLILDTISRHIKDKKIIESSQHGFTKGKSCLTNLINLYDDMTGLVDEGRAVSIVCLDFREVSHKILIDKLWLGSLV
ncbi:hypothetical protein QYF61_020727 [Mycteria americana]|uniref:Reverse transcriptase domain-containing protein n=1 Tax=Mycteria americana TaxID=33587 RepID=A0AAN7S9F0_MYCAM|nr:hypothetical protein QYF61_020727 [Mycteria americana]